MKALLDAFWRAAAYCLHPQVIALSLLPVVIGAALAFGMGWLFWEPALDGVKAALESWALLDMALKWIESFAGASFRSVLAPAIVVALAVPLVVVVSVLLVAVLVTPAVVRLVAARRFAQLERKRGAGIVGSVFWSLGYTLIALVMLLASLPLWLIPPLVLLLPPLIWGWLTTKVMAYDALAEHASRDERRAVMRQHRWPLLAIGVTAGYLGAAPTLLWAVSAAALVFAPLLLVASVWLYTLIFVFSAAWFAHYALAALDALRRDAATAAAMGTAPPAPPVPATLPAPPGATGPAPAIDLLPPP
jgi:Etoposide-induced protein 2.4 (EI24)